MHTKAACSIVAEASSAPNGVPRFGRRQTNPAKIAVIFTMVFFAPTTVHVAARFLWAGFNWCVWSHRGKNKKKFRDRAAGTMCVCVCVCVRVQGTSLRFFPPGGHKRRKQSLLMQHLSIEQTPLGQPVLS